MGRILLVAAAAAFVLCGRDAQAGRPMETEDPGTAPLRSAEVEAGLEYAGWFEDVGALHLGLNLAYGLLEDLEIAASTGGTLAEDAGGSASAELSHSALFAKWRFLGEDWVTPSLAVFVAFSPPTQRRDAWFERSGYAASGGLAFSLPLTGSLLFRLAGLYGAVLDEPDTATGLIGIEGRVGVVVLVAEAGSDQDLSRPLDESMRCLVGAAFPVSDAASLDAAVRWGTSGGEEELAVLAGITVGLF